MHFVYILHSREKNKFYIGYTANLQDRVDRHLNKRSKYTKKFDWKLVYYEKFKEKTLALKREKYLKSLKNKRYLKWIISRAVSSVGRASAF